MHNYVAQHQRDLAERIQKAMECHHPSMAVTTRYGYIARTRTATMPSTRIQLPMLIHYTITIINTFTTR